MKSNTEQKQSGAIHDHAEKLNEKELEEVSGGMFWNRGIRIRGDDPQLTEIEGFAPRLPDSQVEIDAARK